METNTSTFSAEQMAKDYELSLTQIRLALNLPVTATYNATNFDEAYHAYHDFDEDSEDETTALLQLAKFSLEQTKAVSNFEEAKTAYDNAPDILIAQKPALLKKIEFCPTVDEAKELYDDAKTSGFGVEVHDAAFEKWLSLCETIEDAKVFFAKVPEETVYKRRAFELLLSLCKEAQEAVDVYNSSITGSCSEVELLALKRIATLLGWSEPEKVGVSAE